MYWHGKTAQSAGTLSNSSALVDYSNISAGFVNSLINASAFDTMRVGGMVLVPLTTASVGAVSIGAQFYSLGEGSAKPVSRMTITAQQMTPTKVHGCVVVTQELARSTQPGALQLIERGLRTGCAGLTDLAFIANISIGAPVATSTGQTAEAVRADIANLLRAISTGQDSKLYLLVTPLICKSWSMLTDSKGLSAFPTLSPTGGTVNGVIVIASDGVPTGQVILADASGIAASPGEMILQQFSEGSFQADSSPDSPQTAATNLISLWQLNLTAVVIERFLCAVKLRSDAVAVCFNSGSYSSGNSPP